MSLVAASGLALPGRLQPTDLVLAAGSLTCLVGPNGSGKTSLLHALAGVGAAAGQVQVSGRNARAATTAERVRLVGYLPAGREVKWPITAADLIALGGASPEEVTTAAALLDLGSLGQRTVDRLSTGERSRVLIARALATSPQLLLLDEPTANLDPWWQIRLMELVGREVRDRSAAALVAMHDLDAAARHADRLLVMSGGRIVADGPPHQVLNGPVIGKVFGIERRDGEWRMRPA